MRDRRIEARTFSRAASTTARPRGCVANAPTRRRSRKAYSPPEAEVQANSIRALQDQTGSRLRILRKQTHSFGFRAPADLAEKIHQRLQRRPDLPSTRIVKKHPVERRRRPFVEDGDKAPHGEVRSHVVERRLKQPHAFDRRPHSEPAIIVGQPSLRMNLHVPSFHSKAPRNES